MDIFREAGNAYRGATRFAGERLAEFRDQRFVPALDAAMERGIVPADAGMFGRYLTGTKVPLTKVPADVRQGEQQYVQSMQKLNNQVDSRKKKYAQLKAEQDALGLDFNKDYSRSFPNQVTREKISRYNELEEEILRLSPDTIPSGSRPKISFDPRNYATTGYGGTQAAFYSKGEDINKLRNTLGQYNVQDGVVRDRYDFDRNNEFVEGKPFEHGGTFGQGGITNQLATQAGRLSQSLGLIRPGSGYDVKFKVRQ